MRPLLYEKGYIHLGQFQSQMRSRSTCDPFVIEILIAKEIVSISDEKPLHMRLPRARDGRVVRYEFQSQMRSRSTCDLEDAAGVAGAYLVSISDEKPLHMRRKVRPVEAAYDPRFQ